MFVIESHSFEGGDASGEGEEVDMSVWKFFFCVGDSGMSEDDGPEFCEVDEEDIFWIFFWIDLSWEEVSPRFSDDGECEARGCSDVGVDESHFVDF